MELTVLLTAQPLSRPPAIRRSRRSEWLYTTDIPMLLSTKEMEELQTGLIRSKWEYEKNCDWILLRKEATEPPKDWYDGGFGPEAACCLSLLGRHPSSPEYNAGAAQRMLIKAGEEGEKAYESACALIHSLWAEKLRKNERLPAVSRKYFGA